MKYRRSAPRGSAAGTVHRNAQSIDCRHHAPISIAPRFDGAPALRVGLRPSAAISGSSRQEFPTMVALEPQVVGHSSPAPIHDEFPFNPFVITFETEGNETLALGFWAAIRKSASILDFSTRRSRQCTADDARKTLTQRADYSQMTAKARAKIRWIKQRSK